MKTIGLLGGVASGKSTVAEVFQSLGAGVLDADEAGHEVLRMPKIRAAIGGRWGQEVIGPDGEIDRKALAKIVFAPTPAGPVELRELERLTHPEIGARLHNQAAVLARQGVRLAVLDAPVLLKAGWDSLCDALVFVDTPRGEREARALARGWLAAEFARREAAQESVETKRQQSDFVLDNSGDFGYIRSQVERLWQTLMPTNSE